MRILLCTDYWDSHDNAPQRRWEWLSQILHAEGHELDVICPRYIGRLKQDDPVSAAKPQITWIRQCFRFPAWREGRGLRKRIFSQGSRLVGSVGFSFLIAPFLRRRNYDLVVGTVPAIPTIFQTLLVSKLLGTAMVVDLRDPWPHLLSDAKKWDAEVGAPRGSDSSVMSHVKRRALKLVEQAFWSALRASDGIIFTSCRFEKEVAQELRKTMGGDATASVSGPITTTIRNVYGSPCPRRNQPAPVVTQRPGIRVIYAGTIGRAQGLAGVVKSVSRAASTGVDIELKIIGSGAAKNALQEQISRDDIDNVHIMDRVTRDELNEQYEWANVGLISLADWPPLEYAVPSKLFDLIDQQIFIACSAEGEAADMVRQFNLGACCPPGDTESLADLWAQLDEKGVPRLNTEFSRTWLDQERNDGTAHRLGEFLKDISARRESEIGSVVREP